MTMKIFADFPVEFLCGDNFKLHTKSWGIKLDVFNFIAWEKNQYKKYRTASSLCK